MTEQHNAIRPSKENTKFNSKRRFLLGLLTLIFLSIASLYGLYWWTISRFYQSTDNAYVNGNIIPITAQIGGTVIAVKVDDTEFVKVGQTLVQLDPIDSLIALQQTKANLAQTVRDTQQLFINNKGLKAVLKEREIALEKARKDLARRQRAIGIGAISKEELTHANDLFKAAEASLLQAKAALLANLALTKNTSLSEHPTILASAAQLKQAYINYRRTTISAPSSGEISKRMVQVGQRIDAGLRLMAIIPLEQVWVEANFKESQLKDIRIGQPVRLSADLYGSSISYHGKIAGFSAGTGSAFALLPAQNATGNWIKIVQRLPVRIALNPKELRAHPLRIGLSMAVSVDMHDKSGPLIANTTKTLYQTSIYERLNQEAEQEIGSIIQENIAKTANLKPEVAQAKK